MEPIILQLLLYCPLIAWTPSPATGAEILHYEVFVDGVLHHTVVEPQTDAACFHDEKPHTVAVQAVGRRLDTGEEIRSEVSDTSTDPKLTFVINPPLRLEPLLPAVQADFDGDGVVGFSDFGVWIRQFNKCHDGRREVLCRP